jgi:hypothetical protein
MMLERKAGVAAGRSRDIVRISIADQECPADAA